MYSTSIEGNRYAVRCLSVTEYVSSERFIVDTGAVYTCCYYKAVNRNLKEERLNEHEYKNLCGIVKGVAVKYYKYPLKQFTIGNIDLGKQHIWITFDERVTDIVLGMDILQQVIFTANPYNKKIYFCKNADDYEQNFQLES